MSKRLDKPSGIPKPAMKPIVASSSKTVGVLKAPQVPSGSGVTGRFPLSRDLTNLRGGRLKRAVSPDLGRSKDLNARVKLRRSRSFNDIRDVKSVNSLKRPAATLPPIPAKRVATTSNSVQSRAKAPPTKPAIGATAGTKPLRPETKTRPPNADLPKAAPVERIKPYDYKARFNALLEKHKILKEKFEIQQGQIADFENVSEQYEEAQGELQKTQQELTSMKIDNECLQKTNKAQLDQIKNLTNDLEQTRATLASLESEMLKLQHDHREMTERKESLEEERNFLTDENASMREDLEACREQVFAAVTERKELHNQMMDLRGNIRVFCRVRPPLESEMERQLCGWQYLDEASLEISSTDPKLKCQKLNFSFDHVFHPRVSQDEVFDNVSPLIQSAMDGYNVCIFAYGQTGSGKTYTMDGGNGQLGVIPRTVNLLFNSVKKYKHIGWEYEIKATFLEIYNEVLYDLLDPAITDLEIRMVSATSKSEVYVSNITEKTVHSIDELHYWIDVAKSNRATACTVGNERSSRSHAVIQLKLHGIHKGKEERCLGTINLVDLAGSESPKTSTRMEETKKINKSLSELTNVIIALLNKQDHVPYRNSKLTHLLMPSLGGNSKTLMFINVAPFQDCHAESVKSLRFAASVNSIKLRVKKNRGYHNSQIADISN
ncbi:Kinesin-like protein [Sergentomyia squamirostris]